MLHSSSLLINKNAEWLKNANSKNIIRNVRAFRVLYCCHAFLFMERERGYKKYVAV